MNEQQALAKMVAPGTKRPGKYRSGVIQILVTRACNLSCFGCTQGSNLAGKPMFITPEQYEIALQSLEGYWGVVGMFGGCPSMHPQFETLCLLLQKYFPKEPLMSFVEIGQNLDHLD
jgi:molybdenum cofactor biosynthesis enzyme MoaA